MTLRETGAAGNGGVFAALAADTAPAPVPSAASPAALRSRLRRLVMILRMVLLPVVVLFSGLGDVLRTGRQATLLALTSQATARIPCAVPASRVARLTQSARPRCRSA